MRGLGWNLRLRFRDESERCPEHPAQRMHQRFSGLVLASVKGEP